MGQRIQSGPAGEIACANRLDTKLQSACPVTSTSVLAIRDASIQIGDRLSPESARKVAKRIDTETILTARAPANVLERSAADVSYLAGMLIDKFSYHFPLYRQHQRPRDSGIELSRFTLNHWTSRAIDPLAPITAAQSAHVLTSRVLAMDETSIKAGREAKGKMLYRVAVAGGQQLAHDLLAAGLTPQTFED